MMTTPMLRRIAGLLILASSTLSCASAGATDPDVTRAVDAFVEADAPAPSDALDAAEVDDAQQPWTPDALWEAYDPARCPTFPDGFDARGFDHGHALLAAGGENGFFVDRLFYLFTVLARDPATRGTLRSDAALAALADDRAARVAAAQSGAPDDVAALIDALRGCSHIF